MKYVITGSLGHISKVITDQLVQAGHQVTVISSHPDRAKEIASLGAVAAIGSVTDSSFLKKTFSGADAVYTMVPPIYQTQHWKEDIASVGENYAAALRDSGVSHVVNLSSIGADLGSGTGPVDGLHRVEQALNTLDNINIIHLRPGYFYYNLLSQVNLVKNMGIMGGNFATGEKKFVIVDPSDIAAVAFNHLLLRDFTGHTVEYIASDETGTDEIASVIGQAIGNPGLKWTRFSNDQALQGAIQAGLPEELAKNFIEMNQAIDSGNMFKDYFQHRPKLGKVKLADFAKQFASAFKSSAVEAHS